MCLTRILIAEDILYEGLKNGDIAIIKKEAENRGLSSEGNLQEIVSAILSDEVSKYEKTFLSLKEKEGMDNFLFLKNAEAAEYISDDSGEEIVNLYGPLTLINGERKLNADRVTVNLTGEFFTAQGNVTFQDKGKEYFARGIFYSLDDSQALFFDVKTNISKFQYTADLIDKLSDGDKYVAKNVSISTCRIDFPHYQLKADELDIYDNEKVLISNAELWYGHDVVFRFPYYLKKIPEPSLKTSIYFRERAGLVVQNTYEVYKTDTKELLLKGDFYERLGLFGGLSYLKKDENSYTEFNGSIAASNDIYYYSDVTENWSPLGPPGSKSPSIHKRIRYLTGLDQRFNFGDSLKSETGILFNWVSDPYYMYDFENRKTRFDVFDLIGEAESDFPKKSGGFRWSLWYSGKMGNLGLYADNSIWFEPQRNTDEEYVWLPDYYEFRKYKLQAPYVSISYNKNLIMNDLFYFLDDASFKSAMDYSHLVYYNSYGKYSSELHSAQISTGLTKKYQISDVFSTEPGVETGLKAQGHVNPDASEKQDDNLNTMVYSKIDNRIKAGSDKAGIIMDYALNYKLAGPDDLFPYNKFREHYLNFSSYLKSNYYSAGLSTRYDLRIIYDWQKNQYESFKLDADRFYPLYGNIGIYPSKNLSIDNRFVFDIPSLQMRLNNFSLSFNKSFFYSEGKSIDTSWKLEWEHNFLNPVLDRFNSLFSIKGNIHRFLYLYFTVLSTNENLWRYIPSYAKEQGVEWVNPLKDLLKSYNFFNRKDRREALFKLKAISFGLVHDLHEWEIKADYTGRYQLSYDGTRYEWNNTFTIGLGLKEIKDVNIHTTFSGTR